MPKGKPAIRLARCALTGEEYIRCEPGAVGITDIEALGEEDFSGCVSIALESQGNSIYPADRGPEGAGAHGALILLESHAFEKGNWKSGSWRLVACIKGAGPGAGKVGAQELGPLFAKAEAEGAEPGIAVTTGGFDSSVRDLARERGLTLIEGPGLLDMVKHASSETGLSPRALSIPPALRGELMALKASAQGLARSTNTVTGRWAGALRLEALVSNLAARSRELPAGGAGELTAALERMSESIGALEAALAEVHSILGDEEPEPAD